MSEALVSIIIPTFNRAHLIKETLDSVIKQSYTNWECIVVDDHSTDNIKEVIDYYIKSDSRFKFYERPKNRPKGANACRNYGFELSKGEYINWFDSDDMMHPNFLETKVEILKRNPGLDFCACISRTFKDVINNLGIVEKPPILNSKNYVEDYLLNGLYFYTPSPMWRLSFLKDKDLFDETLYRSQERDFHFRMLTYNPSYYYLEEVLFYVRIEGDSISTKANTSILAQKSIFKYFNNVFSYLKNNETVSNKERLLQYVFYRQATNYYNISQLCTGFWQRFNILFSHGKYLKAYIKLNSALNQHSRRISLGFIILLLFKKGYKYFYYPQYDFRKKE